MADDPVYGSGTLKDLQTLLQGLNLLGQDISTPGRPAENDPGTWALESAATSVTMLGGKLVTALGGLSVVGAAIAAFWKGSNDSIRVPAIWSLGIVAAAAAIALALLIASDLRARAYGQRAMYDARSVVAAEFLKLSKPAPVPTPAPAPQSKAAAEPACDG